ncbi:eukaryotic rRNA processing protein EBP2-domain-containing protein [Apiosordaria backusii]|uniref:Eukaryotic rRNA processing protein EBP2-domain-containing protein n=1 Tax=Apiosordaria backusii TaxID=314023 RepID=A0AA40BJZ1_9PEZI|nr:eukaryotic rRNA processing protein EBP2-domain-containing protein [Apiosordaria backusii]
MAKKGAKLTAKAPIANKQSNRVTDKKQKVDKRKSNDPPVEADEEEWEDEDSEEDSEDESADEEGGVDFSKLEDINDSDSDSEINSDDDEDEQEEEEAESDDSEGEESEIDVDGLDLDGLDPEEKEELAATTRVRQTINNKDALLASLKRISLLPLDSNNSKKSAPIPFSYHMTLVSSAPTESAIPSIDDDLERELAFLNQAREAALRARSLLKKEGVPFTRPTDYFAETLRSDETMQQVKQKMIEVATAKKASAEARKQRDLKKFGKQVQVQKQQERAKEKRATLEKINDLKRKRKDGGSASLGAREADDMFDVAVDNELGNTTKPGGKRGRSAGDHGPPNAKRQKKNEKYGFGGKKKFGKSGDAMSSGDMSGFNAKRMKHGGGAGDGKKAFSAGAGGKPKGSKPRVGKDRRKAQAGRR